MPVNFRFDGSYLKQPQIEEDDSWEITKGVKAGYHQTLGLFGGLKALAGSVLDDDEWLYDGLEYYQEKMDDASLYAGDVERIEDAESISDYLSYAAYTLGTVAPTIVGTGGVGAVAGFATKKVISKSVAEASKTIAKNASSKEAGEALAKKYAQVTLGKRGGLATIAGATTTSMGLESGAAFGRIYEEEGTENPVPALAAGIAAGSLEALGALKVLKNILPDGQFLFAKQQIAEETLKKRGVFNRVLREGAKGAGIEGVTEGIQEIIQQGAVSYVKQQNNPELEGQFIDLMTEEAALSGYLNSFVAGALGGGTIRGAMGILGEQTDPPELTKEEQEQVDDLKRPKLQPTELPLGLPTPQSIDIRETTARREERQADADAQINEPFPQPDTGRQQRKQDAVRQINEGLSTGARARVLVQDLLEEADDLAQSEADTRASAQQDVQDRIDNLPDQREPGQTPEQIRARIRKQEELDRQRGRRAERRDRDLPDRDVIYGFDLIEKPPKRPKVTIPQADRREPIVDAMNQPIDQSGTPLDRAVGQIVTYEGIEGVLVRGEDGFYIETADGREFIERGESGTLETLGIEPTGRFPDPNLGVARTVDYNPDDNTFVVNRGRSRSKRYKYLGTNTRDDGVFEVVAETEDGERRNFVSPRIVRQLLNQVRDAEAEQPVAVPEQEQPINNPVVAPPREPVQGPLTRRQRIEVRTKGVASYNQAKQQEYDENEINTLYTNKALYTDAYEDGFNDKYGDADLPDNELYRVAYNAGKQQAIIERKEARKNTEQTANIEPQIEQQAEQSFIQPVEEKPEEETAPIEPQFTDKPLRTVDQVEPVESESVGTSELLAMRDKPVTINTNRPTYIAMMANRAAGQEIGNFYEITPYDETTYSVKDQDGTLRFVNTKNEIEEYFNLQSRAQWRIQVDDPNSPTARAFRRLDDEEVQGLRKPVEPLEQQDKPVKIDQPDIVTKSDGTAFKTRKEARLKLKQYPDHRVVAVDDGFELHYEEFYKANLKDKRAQQAKKNFRVRNVDESKDDLLLAVAKLGGLDRDISLSEGVDSEEFKTSRAKGLWIFPKTGGLGWDDMSLYLSERGYVSDLDEFRDKLFDSLAGRNTFYSVSAQEDLVEQAYNEMLDDEQERLLFEEEADADALENVSQFEDNEVLGDLKLDESLIALSVVRAQEAGVSNDDILNALTEYENDSIGARQELNFLRLDNERSNDTPRQGDERSRTAEEAEAQASTQGVFGQVSSDQEKQAEAEYFGLESETEAERQDREQQIQRQQDAESTRQLAAQQRQQADTEAKDFRLSGSTAPADTAMAGGQRNLLDTDKTKFSEATDNIPTETTKAESQKDATVLNNRFALQFQDKSWRDAFEQVEAPKQFAEVANAIEKAFGRRTVFVRPNDKKFDTFRGVYVPQNKKTLYVNANSQVNFASVVGHEMLHDLKNTRKDLYNYLLGNAKTHFQNIDAYKAKLKDADNVDIEQEILADFTGDAFTDPAFMEQLAKDNPSKFKQLLNAITQWIQKLVNKLKGFESDQYFDDVASMRDYLRKVLDAFANNDSLDAFLSKAKKQDPNFEPKYAPSFHIEGWGETVGLTPREVDALAETGDVQRGEPESSMVRAQSALGGGVKSYVLEHLGDLVNRMSAQHSVGFAYESGLDKIDKVLRTLEHRYGHDKDAEENLISNADYSNIPIDEYRKKVSEAVAEYAEAHKKIPVYTEIHALANKATVLYAEGNTSGAAGLLKTLRSRIDTEDKFIAEVSKVDLSIQSKDINLEPKFSLPNQNYDETQSAWDAAKAKGLDMSQEGRMKRAREQGFDTEIVYYHGTPQGESFDAFEYKYTGKGVDQFGVGFYLTSYPEQANSFTGGEFEGAVIPVYTRGNLLKVDGEDIDKLSDILTLDASKTREVLEQAEPLKRSADDENTNPFGDRYESFWSEGPQPWMLDQLAEDQAGRDPHELADFFDGDMETYLTALSDVTGYDGIEIDYGYLKKGMKNQIYWNPQQIRSVNAAFDPDNMDSPNLLFSQNETKEAGKIKKITDKVAKTLQRNLSPGGLLPKVAFDAKIERDGEIQEREIDIRQLLGLFDKAVKKTDDIEMLNEALGTRFVEIDSMPISEDMKSVLKQMRRYIDSMTKEYATVLFEEAQNFAAQNKTSAAMAKVDLLNTIASNIGRYLNRSYRAFDDPKWPDKVSAEVKAAAIKYLEDNGAENAEFKVNNILKEGTAFDSMQGFIKESKLGAKDLSILKRKKDIAPEIRALLGEYKDPKINFAKTATKMSRLLSNDRFLKRVLENGRGVFLFDENDAPPDHYKRIASDQSSVMSPLNGLYTSPETEQAFKDILDTEQMPDWVRRIVKINGMVKYGKTVLSLTTQARNWMSASFFAIANGHNPLRMGKSIENIKTHMSGQGNTEYLKKLARLGVTYDTPNSGEMMDLLRDTNLGDDILNQTGKSKNWVQKSLGLATKLYQYGDDFWKIVGFQNEVDILMKHKKISREEAEPLAAKRIRDTYPTYSLVGRGVKKLRRFPLAGTFVSFPAEIIRTGFNIFRHLGSEMKDPEMRGVVPRRVAGLGMVSSAAYALQEALLSSNDISEEEEESLRLLLPEWSRNSNIAITGRDENGALQYIDLSHMDPYAYFKKPFTALMRDQPLDDAIVQAGLEFLTPFFGADITASVVNEVWKNKKKSGGKVYNEEDSPENQSADIGWHLFKGLGPGVVNNGIRTIKAIQGEVSPSGKKYKFDEEMKAWVGFRMGTFDPKVALYYKTFEFNEAKRSSSAILKKVFTDPNKVSDNELEGAFNRAETARRRAFEKMIKIVTAARQSGLNRTKLMSVLRSAGISRKDAKAIIKGEMSKWEMTDSSLKRSLKKADLLYEDGKKISGTYESRWSKIERMLD